MSKIFVTPKTDELNRRAEELMHGSGTRYQVTVQVAKRAKRCRFEALRFLKCQMN